MVGSSSSSWLGSPDGFLLVIWNAVGEGVGDGCAVAVVVVCRDGMALRVGSILSIIDGIADDEGTLDKEGDKEGGVLTVVNCKFRCVSSSWLCTAAVVDGSVRRRIIVIKNRKKRVPVVVK